jgi:hypothetical protein
MNDPFISLARARQLATGSPLEIDAPDLTPRCTSDAELDRLVTDYDKFFCEDLSGDVAFLMRIRSERDVEVFRRLVYNLRTATNHTDNRKATDASHRWRAQHNSPQDAADTLAEALRTVLTKLSTVALEVARRQLDAARWRDLLLVDVAAVFAAVEADLDLSFTDGNRKRMVRLVEKRVEVHPVQGDHRAVLADYCVQEVISDRRALPVPYDKVLDMLGVIGKPDAVGVVLMAYTVAEIAPQLRAEEFLARVEKTWRAAANSGSG